ncbi:hypothetical protein O9H85_25185 [Paenibacillus filicis]|uniref:Uncharacterized protein n=1 Tax=Paenibacillus gyeongsangnamensis TaxID=3388067 RepID=A0ABT4QFI6_9BACL|nr:hypothetical protein [Paenibacillus filicis]MCZ8515644.1 hypothetical protein [Paenibacillus filicis]
MSTQTIDKHLEEALKHLESAINQSVHTVLENDGARHEIGAKWQHFLGTFYGLVKEKGRKSRVNLLSWISFAKLR